MMPMVDLVVSAMWFMSGAFMVSWKERKIGNGTWDVTKPTNKNKCCSLEKHNEKGAKKRDGPYNQSRVLPATSFTCGIKRNKCDKCVSNATQVPEVTDVVKALTTG